MNFSSNFFLKVDLIGCFRELHVRKFRKFSPDHFYDLKNRFYDKKTIKSTFRKKLLEKFILINFHPLPKEIKVLTKFHNFKPPEMKVFFSAAGGLPRPSSDPPWPPSDPPKSPQDPPKVGPRRPQSDQESTQSQPERLSSVLWSHDLTS